LRVLRTFGRKVSVGLQARDQSVKLLLGRSFCCLRKAANGCRACCREH
jgi:hypothetical protein